MRPLFSYASPSRFGLSRPSLTDILDPFSGDPEYPDEPAPITRGRQLDKDSKRQLTMQMLATLAQAFAGNGGDLGGRLAQAAAMNIGNEQEAVAGSNERGQRSYLEKRQEAERSAKAKQAGAQREQERAQVESAMAVGDKAIEAAGGADADPQFAAKVYGFMRTRNYSALNSALDEGAHRRLMREQYKLDPDDPMALESWKQKRDAQAAHDAKLKDAAEVDPILNANDFEKHKRERDYDVQHPLPVHHEPDRDRVWVDPTFGVINMDATLRAAGPGATVASIPGYTPKPRSAQMFDEVEEKALKRVSELRTEYEKNAPMYHGDRPGDDVEQKARNRRFPGFTNEQRLWGQPVPFDGESAYRSEEKLLRKLALEKLAKEDPSPGVRGPAPSTSPTAKNVQAPKGAPVGMGGAPQTKQSATAGLTEDEQTRISAEAHRRWKTMTTEQKRKYGGMGVMGLIQEAMRQAQAAKGRP